MEQIEPATPPETQPWRRPLRAIAARPRLMLCVIAGIVVYFLLPSGLLQATRALIAWDCAVTAFIGLCLQMMAAVDQPTLRRHAMEQDEGRNVILILALGAAIASISVIATELAGVKGTGTRLELLHVFFTVSTIALSWGFVQIVFALHYASIYHSPFADGAEGTRCGLAFPGGEEPDYWDFLHFSIVIGVANQTADIAIRSKEMRRIATVHSLIAFAFNAAILALMINLAAGLF